MKSSDVYFSHTMRTVAITRYQGDYGQRVILHGKYIVAGMPVQWAYGGIDGVDSRMIEQDGDDLVAAIPDAALAQSGQVKGYVYIHDVTSGNTVYIITVNIEPRESTDEHASTDETTYIGQLVDNAEAAAAAAGESETAAAASAATAESEADRATNNILNGVATHNADEAAHPSLISDIAAAEAIARGRARAHVFDTYDEMVAWLAVPENVADLLVGDNLYIIDTGVSDYWWDGTSAQELEAESPDLVDYYNKTETDARLPIVIEDADYDALVAAGTVIAGRIYYVVPDGSLS